eukprot:CAMPEP_0177571198 /NCGR_PEP_ID=MMETSP0369-20130122/77302_1 /TAXON_ID=447022 ORGANISM="Scrippsiella hangoei-like, Strain SHHI-4" /NCGR_SAMPLE_ID=MMETSP0369 /ASSEMBLY_ACC=CAM_ASM_000364 /LENGTH=752 /DNA_ID=CAMNT_0019059099 /DNA_START=24 /DNA_END=2281 /DNA_ORIENTATION=-
MLANQNLLIETMQAGHRHTESVLALLTKACAKMGVSDVETECEQMRTVLRDTDSMFTTLRDASTADLGQVLQDVKKYAADVVAAESRELQSTLSQKAHSSDADLLATSEAQVSSQLQLMTQDIEKKIAFLGSQPRGGAGSAGPAAGMDSYAHDMDAIKYDVGELKDLVNGTKSDTAHVKRIVLACERDMEDFTAAMDAVNVDLDEMRARVDSTHSIITSRQRVEATVTAEISTMRLDMGDMQEALKAHDAWMEDVSQSLQEAHERCHQLAEDIAEVRDQTQAKLDAKTDITAWNDMNDDIDSSIKTVRDMTSALRLEVDSRRRKVDETLNQIRGEMKSVDGKVDANHDQTQRYMEEAHTAIHDRLEQSASQARGLEATANRHVEIHQEMDSKMDQNHANLEIRHSKLEADLRKQDEDLHKEVNDRMDGVERHHAGVAKETSKRVNALDLRISGLQGASGEAKRDINKLRDETNSLMVKTAAHDVDIGKSSDDLRKIERSRAEDNQRAKQDLDAIYEELDQKVYEKNFQGLEDNVIKLTRGTVKLCQVVGVFPGARMNDGTEEELDVDVELLNWEDCAQNMSGRVEKVWRQVSSQKYRSLLDLVSKKADHSVLRLLQISQQHIESQLDRVRHERELWKEVVDKRAQQPLQLALTLKDPHTGMPLSGGPGGMPYGGPGGFPGGMPYGGPGGMPQGGLPPVAYTPRSMSAAGQEPMMGGGNGLVGSPDQQSGIMKASPLAKRIAKPPQGPMVPQR